LNLTSAIGDLANCNIQQDMFPAIMPWPMTPPPLLPSLLPTTIAANAIAAIANMSIAPTNLDC
jgi:hypothetical protein